MLFFISSFLLNKTKKNTTTDSFSFRPLVKISILCDHGPAVQGWVY